MRYVRELFGGAASGWVTSVTTIKTGRLISLNHRFLVEEEMRFALALIICFGRRLVLAVSARGAQAERSSNPNIVPGKRVLIGKLWNKVYN